MTDNQRKALDYFDALDANAVCFTTTGWIWRDDVRQSESAALYLLRHAAKHREAYYGSPTLPRPDTKNATAIRKCF